MKKVTYDDIAPLLQDYELVFGSKTNEFFCPLTREFKPLAELVHGHVFSEQFACSKDTTVVQWGPIDHWFGSAYESHLLEFWKTIRLTPEERLAEAEFYIGVSDGSPPFALGDREYRGYLKDSVVGKQLTSPKCNLDLWVTTIDTPVGPREFVVQGLTNANKPTSGCVYLLGRKTLVPMMVSAAMMKAGFLTLFWLMRYECLNNPLVALVGERIAGSFRSNAREAKAHEFWSEFENAYALIESRSATSEQSAGHTPWHFNSITSKNAIELHRDGIQFAFNFIYDVDGVTVQATFPFTRRKEDADAAWINYKSFLKRQFTVDHGIQSEWDGRCWQPVGPIKYVEQPSAIEHAKQLARGLPPKKQSS
jgi:hypothetical protein